MSFVLALGAAILQPSSLDPSEAIATPREAVVERHGIPDEKMPEDPIHRKLVEKALEELADHLDVARESLRFESFEEVVWGDTSLGCPKEGMVYAQVTREGYRILLRHGKRRYAYHGAGSGPSFLCEARTSGTRGASVSIVSRKNRICAL